MGEYGKCPQCNKHNATEIIINKFDSIEKDFEGKKSTITERAKREMEWKSILSNCVSTFDGLGNELRKHLLFLPYTPKRRAELSKLSFQKILHANDCMYNWFGFSIFSGLKEVDKNFLNQMFNKRHLFTHNNGIVDEKYLKNTSDTNLKLKQLVRLKSNEIQRFNSSG